MSTLKNGQDKTSLGKYASATGVIGILLLILFTNSSFKHPLLLVLSYLLALSGIYFTLYHKGYGDKNKGLKMGVISTVMGALYLLIYYLTVGW